MSDSPSAPSFDIEILLRDQRVAAYFQPIASVRRQDLLGIEALSRGMDERGQIVPPQVMFSAAEAAGVARDLDRLCRQRALEAFSALHRAHPQWILFLNIHASALITDLEGEHSIENLARTHGIDTRNIALEILETEFKDTQALRAAVQTYRTAGFLVVLDDVGAGHANLDRIAFVRPDIIKADGSLVREIENDYYARAVFKSLVTLAEKIGGWIITEGIETPQQAMAVMELGGDIVQGFHFAHPNPPHDDGVVYDKKILLQTAQQFKARMLKTLHSQQNAHRERRNFIENLRQKLHDLRADDFENCLREILNSAPIESVAVLDADGVQITPTILADIQQQKPKCIVFGPPQIGTDHSMKEYVYALSESDDEPFQTQPYVPLPSGDLCVTMSSFFVDASEEKRILVVHFPL